MPDELQPDINQPAQPQQENSFRPTEPISLQNNEINQEKNPTNIGIDQAKTTNGWSTPTDNMGNFDGIEDDEPKKSKTKTLLLVVAIFITTTLVIGGSIASYFFFIKPTPEELFKKALAGSLDVKESDNVSISVNIDATNEKINGEVKGNIDGKNGQLKGDFYINGQIEDFPLSMSMETIAIKTNGKIEQYNKIKSVETTETEYSLLLNNKFNPVKNKWVKMDSVTAEEEQISFEVNGSLDSLAISGIFTPLASLNEKDRNIFLSVANKYNLYEISKDIEKTNFKGTKARKLNISINKQSLQEFEKEVSGSISKDADFEKLDTKYIEDVFGMNEKISCNVYLDPKSAKIIGAEYSINFSKPITSKVTNVPIYKINTSLLAKYNSPLEIKAPPSFISEKEYEALLK